MDQQSKEELKTIIAQAVGAASMCWTQTPQGVFDTTQAIQVATDLYKSIMITIEKSYSKSN